jgi:ketosteroid isomerase-like protein
LKKLSMSQTASKPEDLARLFVERANAGDVEGLVALYEPNAVLACSNGKVATGSDQIRDFYAALLASRPQFTPGAQAPALRNGDIALTSSYLSNGVTTAEIARRQPDGTWLWAVDQPTVANNA